MSVTLYFAPMSSAFAPLVALEEAGIDYTLRRLAIAEGEHRQSAYLAINPIGRIPSLTVDDRPMSEVIAILTWIAAERPEAKLLPHNDPYALGKAYQMMSWFASTLHVALAQVRRPSRYSDDVRVQEELKEPGRQTFRKNLAILEGIAAADNSDWLLGDVFRAVDPYAFVIWRWASLLELDLDEFPALAAKMSRVAQRPSVRRAIEIEKG